MTENDKPAPPPRAAAAAARQAAGARGPAGGAAGRPGGPNRPAAAAPAAPPPVIEIRPIAGPARLRRRHWGLLASFFILVVLPLAAAAWYLWAVAVDQYASTVGFTVRREEGTDAAELIGGLAQFAGAGGSSESDILYEFIQSQEIVGIIDDRIDLRGLYSHNWQTDPVFSLWPDAPIEDLLWFWDRVVRISYDQHSRLIEVRVIAPAPEAAQQIATEIVAESQRMINELNEAAREDVMRYALQDLEVALARLKAAREALTQFRTRTQIVDPAADLQGRMGVLNNLQQQLAQALIDYDLLIDTTNPGDPRLVQAERRIEVIRARIAAERETFATASDEVGALPEDYPSLIAEFESLSVDREFAEETYRAALAALDLARAKASRQSLYLAAYIRPTLPQIAEHPQRWVLAGLLGLFLTLVWAVLALIWYSIRDRR